MAWRGVFVGYERALEIRESITRTESEQRNTNQTRTPFKQSNTSLPQPAKPISTLSNGTIGDHSGDTSAGSEESHRSLL